VLDEGARIE
jgi:hypothetical protein